MTERLYYDEPYRTDFTARVVERSADGLSVYLDRTAFYPTSGGQPFDTGTLDTVPVTDVVDEGARIAHRLAAPLPDVEKVHGVLDWPRRHDHMQQHTGQHLLSAVIQQMFHIPTISFHLGQEASTIDLGVESLTAEQVRAVETRVNELIWEGRPVSIHYQSGGEAQGLRKASDRPGTLRIIVIDGLDRSACGGTHLSSTAGIGVLLLRKLDRIRGSVRLEFLAGGRAVSRARADFDTLSEVARAFSAPLDQTPVLTANLIAKAQDLDKARRKLALELAGFHGRQRYLATLPDEQGLRRYDERVPTLDEETRALAQSFIAGERAVFLAIAEESLALLLAVSADSGRHAGNLLRPILDHVGGRGGGNAQIAQGSVPDRNALEQAIAALRSA